MDSPEIQAATSILQIASQTEKLGIVGILFVICIVLSFLLKKAVGDKHEILKIIAEDKADRDKLNDKIVEGMAKINQTQDEIKNLLRQQQDFTATLMKLYTGKEL